MEDNSNQIYRLDRVANIAGSVHEEDTHLCITSMRRQHGMFLDERIMPYLHMAGLTHLARLNDHWFRLDEPLVSAFVERWGLKTHTFHKLFGNCTITL
ncbi:hypothetical protein Ahy_A08g038158 [Arachis hypogaea]|uniref:Aminotransferase-like plant mobile domain-containing protein n=1 Tax=Arachis hypogaea TaxID=3818 RepID=A0A445BT04_ARAHY|nr:hypothetical protein Ahy_A08g038158 [Arachis hypogaea]